MATTTRLDEILATLAAPKCQLRHLWDDVEETSRLIHRDPDGYGYMRGRLRREIGAARTAESRLRRLAAATVRDARRVALADPAAWPDLSTRSGRVRKLADRLRRLARSAEYREAKADRERYAATWHILVTGTSGAEQQAILDEASRLGRALSALILADLLA